MILVPANIFIEFLHWNDIPSKVYAVPLCLDHSLNTAGNFNFA
jgi:hypothetical protein